VTRGRSKTQASGAADDLFAEPLARQAVGVSPTAHSRKERS
jgi:hypothetical protein